MDNPDNNTIDCIFDINATHIPLIKRGNAPYKGYWALIGGRQKVGEELDNTVIREVKEEAGVIITKKKEGIPLPITVLGQETHLDQVRTYASKKDPRGGNTTVYAIQLYGDVKQIEKQLKNGDDAEDIRIFSLENLPKNLAFNHAQFIEDYFVRLRSYHNPTPAVDLIINYNSGIVYIERGGIPKGKALVGGFAKEGISYEQSAIEEAKEETNLDVKITGLLGVYSDPSRDPRKHVTSTVFIADGYGNLRAGDDAAGAGTFNLDNIPRMVFDHNQVMKDYKSYLSRK